MKSLFTETVYPLQVLLCQRLITKNILEHIGTSTFCFNNSHGISLANYHNLYIMAFDIPFTQEASHDFIHPELTNCTISVELKFDAPHGEKVVLIFMGVRASTIYVRSDIKKLETLS